MVTKLSSWRSLIADFKLSILVKVRSNDYRREMYVCVTWKERIMNFYVIPETFVYTFLKTLK